VALTFYITQVRRLLHDTNAQFYTDAELTDYINEARNRVCKDTRCLRLYLASAVTLTQNVETYPISSIVLPANFAGYTIIDVMGVTVIWGQTRIKLANLPWTRFDAMFRYWNNMQSRPVAYTRQGAINIVIGPLPDQSYVSDWDVAFIPPPLVTDSTPEPVPEPFTTPVKYYAAHLAKFREQAQAEAALFEQKYARSVLVEAKAFQHRVIPDPYAK
jgi:hypothetical protein